MPGLRPGGLVCVSSDRCIFTGRSAGRAASLILPVGGLILSPVELSGFMVRYCKGRSGAVHFSLPLVSGFGHPEINPLLQR